MTEAGKRTAIWIQLAIMLASIAVFLGGVSLVGGGFTERGSRFWVTIVTIVFANFVWFNVPIWMVASGARKKASFPFQLTAMTFCTLYAVGVFCMALIVVVTPIASGWVFVGHMILLFFLASSLGVYAMANRAVESMDTADHMAKSGANRLSIQVKSVADRAALCEQQGVKAATDAIDELVDCLRYATGESLPGSEAVDAEIMGHVEVIESALIAIDDAENTDAVADFVKRICREAKSAKLAVGRREDLMKTLR